MSLAMRIVRSIWGMPNQRPSLSVVLTGAISALALLIGVLVALGGQAAPAPGLLLVLAGLVLLAAAAHAGYRTGGLQHWERAFDGQRSVVNGHIVARWLGPIGLLIAFVCCFAWLGLLVLTTSIIRAATSSNG